MCAGRCRPSLWADRQSDDVAAIRCSDRLKLVGRAIADGLGTSIETSGSENDYHAPGLAGDIAPAMGDTLRQGDTSPGRHFEDFLSDRDAVATRDDHKMLLLVAMKMHRRGTTGAAMDSTIAFAPFVSRLESRTAIRYP